jgi:hypothetical protein
MKPEFENADGTPYRAPVRSPGGALNENFKANLARLRGARRGRVVVGQTFSYRGLYAGACAILLVHQQFPTASVDMLRRIVLKCCAAPGKIGDPRAEVVFVEFEREASPRVLEYMLELGDTE